MLLTLLSMIFVAPLSVCLSHYRKGYCLANFKSSSLFPSRARSTERLRYVCLGILGQGMAARAFRNMLPISSLLSSFNPNLHRTLPQKHVWRYAAWSKKSLTYSAHLQWQLTTATDPSFTLVSWRNCLPNQWQDWTPCHLQLQRTRLFLVSNNAVPSPLLVKHLTRPPEHLRYQLLCTTILLLRRVPRYPHLQRKPHFHSTALLLWGLLTRLDRKLPCL